MLCKRNAISSLMLELDSDDLPQSSRGQLSNSLAQEVVELVKIPDCAMNLVNYEKRIIEQRGSNPAVYLMHSDLNMKEVLKKYYSSIYYDNDGSKKLIPNLSISELMLMLGTFKVLVDRRTKIRQSYENSLKRVKKKTSRKFGYYLRRINGMEELDANLYQEGTLTDDIKEETAFINILTENTDLLEQRIHEILGLKPEEMTQENLARIVKRSKELALSYTKIKEDSNTRRKANTTLLDDVLFLESAGDDPETFERIFEPERHQHEFTKLLKNES